MSKDRKITEYQTDKYLKKLFSRRIVLAVLLKSFVSDFMKMEIEEIAYHCLIPEGKSERLQIINTDDGDNAQYDMVFRVRFPSEGNKPRVVLFNLEFQNKIHPGYQITKRGIYYICRLLSDEKGKQFKGSNYNSLEKVFSGKEVKLTKGVLSDPGLLGTVPGGSSVLLLEKLEKSTYAGIVSELNYLKGRDVAVKGLVLFE